jgi:hypothetical protein
MHIEFTNIANSYGNGPATTYKVWNKDTGECIGNGRHLKKAFAVWTLLLGGEYQTFKTKTALMAHIA